MKTRFQGQITYEVIVMTTLSVNRKTGQAYIYMPKALFESTGWKQGDKLSWEILGKDKLKLEKIKKMELSA